MKIDSISGAVKSPVDCPLGEGDRVFDLIRAAGSLRDLAYLPALEFLRIVAQDDGSVEPSYKDLSLVDLASSADVNNIELASRDHLTVRDISDWSPDQSVELVGEVKFPGAYLIWQDKTLVDVIQRAGGLY